MTPKQEYDARQRVKKERQMAIDETWEARQKKERAADECLVTLLDGLKAFFSGSATLHITPMQPGMGQGVRFIKDAPKQS